MAKASKVRLQLLGNNNESIKDLKEFQAQRATCRNDKDEQKIRSLISSNTKRFEKDIRKLAKRLDESEYRRRLTEALPKAEEWHTEVLPEEPGTSRFDVVSLVSSKRIVNAYEMGHELSDSFCNTDWSNLRGSNVGCAILKTELRAISLEQLDFVMAHVAHRLRREVWIPMQGEEITTCVQVDLYTVNRYIIEPCTEAQLCSFVEFVASSAQPPDYLCAMLYPQSISTDETVYCSVSHWWGEKTPRFVRCLKQHSKDHGLERSGGWYNGGWMDPHPGYLNGRSPCYWVCAFANNRKYAHPTELRNLKHLNAEHDLDSGINKPLKETSFALAIQISKGTISVVDPEGKYYTRIWYSPFSHLTGSECLTIIKKVCFRNSFFDWG